MALSDSQQTIRNNVIQNTRDEIAQQLKRTLVNNYRKSTESDIFILFHIHVWDDGIISNSRFQS